MSTIFRIVVISWWGTHRISIGKVYTSRYQGPESVPTLKLSLKFIGIHFRIMLYNTHIIHISFIYILNITDKIVEKIIKSYT